MARTRPERAWLATTVTAGAAALAGGLLFVVFLVRTLSAAGGPLSVAAWGLAGAGVLLSFAPTVLSALTAIGGMIALRRHAFEAAGRPYATTRRREWKPGVAVRAAIGSLQYVSALLSGTSRRRPLLPYDLVELRKLENIVDTLDSRGTLDALPFMCEMAAFCGQQFRVFRRVEKIHDYVTRTGLRRIRDTVLLEGVRCNGQYHAGCQASCHLLWKEAWLRPVVRRGQPPASADGPRGLSALPTSPLPLAWLRQLAVRMGPGGESHYVCQMTEVARASTPVSWKDPRHYLRDLLLGNVRLAPFVAGLSIEMFNRMHRRFGSGVRFPDVPTTDLATSPNEVLDLHPGDVVRVKPKHEIARTLTVDHRNRGLYFDAEMLRFCGGEFRVSARVDLLIKESSGQLIHPGTPCVILEGVTASGEYRAFCPQNEAILWREIWLERVSPSPLS